MDSTKKLVFEKLTPLDDHNIGIYKSAIDFAFEHGDIRNVAISGAYGAGKSSVLAYYEKTCQGKKFIHISLAHFQDQEYTDGITQNNAGAKAELKSDTINPTKTIRESVLEGKNLNQLIHQIPADKIPQTNFRVKNQFLSENRSFTLSSLHCSLLRFFAYCFLTNGTLWFAPCQKR